MLLAINIKVTESELVTCNLIELLISKNSHYKTDVLFLKRRNACSFSSVEDLF